ncbi:hypothetical protein ACM46_10300 [Chryseobacterium angstadtii]|uniref:Uncharacterized protein n=1 Tax=Chryseobacterium angstadtii TaxID=558151 RepID=A0A0J7IET2_9FLAO|nr:hypothetical protein [Chryseobacterium angstadtii]KMQ64632.1 hypothetical protein ACM46_10300 [Chryseobacterium angstadtii]
MATRITITDSGQTQTLNGPLAPDTPDDSLQRISEVYFAKKTTTDNGTRVSFTKIDSAHAQQDHQNQNQNLPYDSILGKTVYLIIETSNMQTLSIDAVIRPSANTLTDNTETLQLMRFLSPDRYEAQRLFTVQVGNFDALNNNAGSHTHYTNLSDHINKAIIKLQLRPDGRAIFDEWSGRLGENTVNLEVAVERTDNSPCAYKDGQEEVNGAGIFLNDDTGRFRVVNKNIYTIHHGSNAYNTLTETNTGERRRIQKVLNTHSTEVIYFYYDQNDNEHRICSRTKETVTRKRRVNTIPPVAQRGELTQTISFTANRAAGENIDATQLLVYTNGTLGDGATDKWYANQPGTVELVDMDILANAGVGPQIFEAFNYNRDGVIIRYGFQHTRRRSIQPDLFSGFLGALAQFRQEGHSHYIVSQGFSYSDASCYPSAEHVNGEAGDLNLLTTQEDGVNTILTAANFDYDNAVILRNILFNFGFILGRSENFTNTSNASTADNVNTRLPHTTHTATPRHNNHLHIHGFAQISDIYA